MNKNGVMECWSAGELDRPNAPAINSITPSFHHSLNPIQRVLTLAIRAYQLTLSPTLVFLFGATGGCRFTPTCSQYALEAVREHGAIAGGRLAARRICRCHPWGNCGHDPVPEKGCGI
jgi:uncharacterized protein